jgi:hypothetical protein
MRKAGMVVSFIGGAWQGRRDYHISHMQSTLIFVIFVFEKSNLEKNFLKL